MKAKSILRHTFLLPCAILALCMNLQGQTVINNEQIRAGHGSENSINGRGNMQQPFYKSGINWFKLTYSNYPLNATFAAGGDGSNDWNLNGTLLHDPLMANNDVNTSGFTYNSGSSGPGTGVVVSTGELNIESVVLQAQQTYELLPGNSFIKVKVKLTNQSASNAENVRVWIGTRDDWVGTTDRPTKQRGNLIDGSFEQISNASQRASVVRVTSASEGVLFYTDTDKANSILNSCCSFYNVVNQNPSTSVISHSNDGSYGFYVRMDDLAPGESDEFTWFYAAGTIDELETITDQVAQASGAISDITCSGAVFNAQSNESGTGYLIVVPEGSADPTAEQIKAGVDYGDVPVAHATSAAITGGVPHGFDIEGLNHSTAYKSYFVLEDAVPQFSEISGVNFNSGTPPIASISTTASTTCAESGNGTATVSVAGGTAPFTYTWSTGEATAEISGKSPGSYNVEVTDSGGCPAVDAMAEIGTTDVTPPTAIARDVTVYLDESGNATLQAEMVDNGSTDDCEIASMSLSKTSFNCSEMGEHTVVLEVVDQGGNSAQTELKVTIADNTLPSALVEELTVTLDENGFATLDVATADAGSSDNCGITHRELDFENFSCEDLGTKMVTLTVTDASDNTAEASFNVTVVDQTAPSVTFAEAPVIYLDAVGTASPDQEALIAEITDNCGVASTSFDIDTFDCSQVGMRTLQFTATDASGNAETFETQVQVMDTLKPSFNLNTIQVVIDENGFAQLTEEMLLPYASDNCGIAEVAVQHSSLACNPTGIGQTEIIVYDLHGNHIQRTIQVEFQDQIAPTVGVEDFTVTLDQGGSAILSIEDLNYIAEDNCGIASLELSESRFDCSREGNVQVTLTATDHFGNSTAAIFNVSIVDTQAPVFLPVPDLTFCAGQVEFARLIEVEDNCQFTLEQRHGPISGSVLEPGTYSIGFVATDKAGNTANLTTEIKVNPVPKIDAPDEIQVSAGIPFDISVEGQGFTELWWSNGQFGETATYTFDTNSLIWFTVKNRYGCEYSQTIGVIASEGLNTEEKAKEIGFKAYPNPTNGILNLNLEGSALAEEYAVSVTDLHGKLLMQEMWNNAGANAPKTIDTAHLPSGMYLINLRGGKHNQTVKFMKF